MNVTQVKLGSGDEWMYLGSDQEKEGQFVLIITSNHTTYSHMSQNKITLYKCTTHTKIYRTEGEATFVPLKHEDFSTNCRTKYL